jgi:pilus assembly protein CpaC
MKPSFLTRTVRGAALLAVAHLLNVPAMSAQALALAAPTRYAVATSPAGVCDLGDPSGIASNAGNDLLHITVGHSTLLRGATRMRRVYIGNPAVLQSFTSAPSEVILTAKVPGTSSLVLWDEDGKSCLYTVQADVDAEALQRSVQQAYPGSVIAVEGHEGRIYLDGVVPSQEVADAAVKLSLPYAKDVVSSLRVVTPRLKQVQLKLRIVEVDRTRMEQYGINFAGGGKVPFSLSTQQYSAPSVVDGVAQFSDPLNLLVYSAAKNIGATIKDLEQKNILQVLAEPTLTALSGQSAKFLSGGEFPFPVVQGGAGAGGTPAISVQFRPYGVKVDFTPTVNPDGTIRLKVAPEVSTLDFSNAVTISGYTIPALSTRRAETEVEIQSGQSFALSGLLDHRTTESLSHIPGIANIPILGKLFVSKAYQHSVVELVVMVTATIVDPLTETVPIVEPKMSVPNMESDSFDERLGKFQNRSAKP